MKHFISLNKLESTAALKGALVSTLQTQNLTIAYTDMKAGTEIPLHHYPEEAVDIILEGILEMQVGEKTETLSHGMITVVPSNVPHWAKAITDCKVLTVFYPKRNI
jgi:quercetin dioxygenase-like cupin family protein